MKKEVINHSDTITSFSENLISIRENNPNFDRQNLPDNLPNFTNEVDSLESFFELASFYWEEIFKPEALISKLEAYINDKQTNENSVLELKRYFKTLRKSGMILGSVNYLANENPRLNYELIVLLRLMGKLNDFLYDEKGLSFAQELLSFLKTTKLPSPELKITSNEIYQNRIFIIVSEAVDLIKQPKVYVKDFHQLRKDLRHIMNIYQIAAIKNPQDLINLQTFQFLVDLNSILGNIHDSFVGKSALGEIVYETSTVEISEELKETIIKFCLKLIEKLPAS